MTQTATTIKTIKTSELEEFFQDSIQSDVKTYLCNYPSSYNPFIPAEESYVVKFIDEHFALIDDFEDESERFKGVADVEFYEDNNVQKVKITLNGNVWTSKHSTFGRPEFTENGQSIDWCDISDDGFAVFENIFNVTPSPSCFE